MKQIDSFSLGLNSYFDAIGFIFKNKFAWFFIFPLILNILLAFGGLMLINNFTDAAYEGLSAWLNIENWEFTGAGFFGKAIKITLWLIFKIIFFLTFVFFSGYIVLIVLSPVFAYLSEITEQKLTGRDYPFSIRQLISDVARGITIATRNLLIEIGYMIVLFFASFIPVIGFLSAPALLIISSYFYGFSFIDYNLERKKYSVRESVRFVRQNKGMAVGNGLIFALFLLIPFIGVLLSGFFAIISVVAGTLSTEKLLKSDAVKQELKTKYD